jgi:hypothetical protein
MNKILNDTVETLALTGLIGFMLGAIVFSNKNSSTTKLNPDLIQWDLEIENGTLLYRGVYEDSNYNYEATDTNRSAVVESLKNMVEA